MPPVHDSAEYLLGYLYEMGPTSSLGMGAGSVTHVEIRAWQENMGIDLQPWEVLLLRRLSSDYVVEQQKAEKRTRPEPWSDDDLEIVISVASSLQRAMRNLASI